MQDLRPVESQAVCTMTGVRRSEKLCRYAGRVIYDIYKCDAPWPGNEWCKLESTKNPPMSSTSKLPRGFKVSSRWRKGLFESIPGLVNCFFCVNCGCSTGAGCLRFGELTLKGVFFLCKERHTLMKFWFLFRNLSLLSELPIYQPLSTWHVVTLPKNDAHCDSRSASIRRLLGKTFRQEAARGAHIWGMFTFSGAIGMKMKRVPRWERTSWRATLVQPRTMPFNPSGTHPSKHQASQLRKWFDVKQFCKASRNLRPAWLQPWRKFGDEPMQEWTPSAIQTAAFTMRILSRPLKPWTSNNPGISLKPLDWLSMFQYMCFAVRQASLYCVIILLYGLLAAPTCS